MKQILIAVFVCFSMALAAQAAPGTVVSDPVAIKLADGTFAVKQEVLQPITVAQLESQKETVEEKISALVKERDRLKKLIIEINQLNNAAAKN